MDTVYWHLSRSPKDLLWLLHYKSDGLSISNFPGLTLEIMRRKGHKKFHVGSERKMKHMHLLEGQPCCPVAPMHFSEIRIDKVRIEKKPCQQVLSVCWRMQGIHWLHYGKHCTLYAHHTTLISICSSKSKGSSTARSLQRHGTCSRQCPAQQRLWSKKQKLKSLHRLLLLTFRPCQGFGVRFYSLERTCTSSAARCCLNHSEKYVPRTLRYRRWLVRLDLTLVDEKEEDSCTWNGIYSSSLHMCSCPVKWFSLIAKPTAYKYFWKRHSFLDYRAYSGAGSGSTVRWGPLRTPGRKHEMNHIISGSEKKSIVEFNNRTSEANLALGP